MRATARPDVQLHRRRPAGQVPEAAGRQVRGPADLAVPVGKARQVKPELRHEPAVTGYHGKGPAGPGEFLAGGRVAEVGGHAAHQAVDTAEQEVDFRPVPWPELPVQRLMHAAAYPEHLLEQGNRLRRHVVTREPGHVRAELFERGIANAALLGLARPLTRLVGRHQYLVLHDRVRLAGFAGVRLPVGDNAGRPGRCRARGRRSP
jgi:hypothetical protein